MNALTRTRWHTGAQPIHEQWAASRVRQQFHADLNAALASLGDDHRASNPEVDLALAHSPLVGAAKIIATRAELAVKEWPDADYPFSEWAMNPEVICERRREQELEWRHGTERARDHLTISRWLGVPLFVRRREKV